MPLRLWSAPAIIWLVVFSPLAGFGQEAGTAVAKPAPKPPFLLERPVERGDSVTPVEPPKHPFSAAVASALRARLPEFTPTVGSPEGSAPAPTTGVVSGNAIRLGSVVVRGDRPPPEIREKDIHSERDLIAIAKSRYLSELDQVLNRFNLFSFSTDPRAPTGSAESRALDAYDNVERRENIEALTGYAESAALAGNTKQSQAIRRIISETYMRGIDWGYTNHRSLSGGVRRY